MLAPDTNGTLWEEWWRDGSGRTGKFIGGRTRSDAQTESAFPPDLFAKYVLGLEVTQPGMQEITVSIPKYVLKNAKATFPTPHGNCSIEWKIGKTKELTLDVPNGCSVKLDVASLDSKNIVINKEKNKGNKYILLASGKHKVSF